MNYASPNATWLFGGVQMMKWERDILAAVVARGTCPYCGRIGMTNRYGSFRRHRIACGKRLTLLGKEKIFAEWITEAKETGRHIQPHRGSTL